MKIGCAVNISEGNAVSILRDKMYKEGKECRLAIKHNPTMYFRAPGFKSYPETSTLRFFMAFHNS